MKTNTLFTSVIMFFLTVPLVMAQSKKKGEEVVSPWKYEIQAHSVGVQGTYQIKVWSYSSKADVPLEVHKKNAVHGIIFKGFVGTDRIAGKKPLVTSASAEIEHKEYFDDFFKPGGKFEKFVSVIDNASIMAGDRIKIGKEYKVGLVLNVNVDALRKELESAKIIKSLGGGFD